MKNKLLQKQRAFHVALFYVLLLAAGLTNAVAQTGAINGVFAVGENSSVFFSQGNLQYQASTQTWRFAENQWDYVGSDNSNISQTYAGWIDFFGWGTSGYNHGATCYQPWSTSTNFSDYYAYGNSGYNLFDQTGQADWGYNAIINGGNSENSGWRTLTKEEWGYLFNTRSTSSGIRYAKANVNNINGVILLPDDWQTSYYSLNNTNGGNYTSNTITVAQWVTLEQHGAVFLPAAGYRGGTSVYSVGSIGYYWSASFNDSDYAYDVYFGDGDLNASNISHHGFGHSVRLVCPVENYSIHATPSPSEGGAVSGAGAYAEGAECTLTATASAGYTFAYWTQNGRVVSADASYTFTVGGNRDLVAVFAPNVSTGNLHGQFTVGENAMVCFSQGNLQYKASSNTWRFAENQWDYVGADNKNISSDYNGLTDLFGWGTSGYNHGATCYQPWSTSTSYSSYYAYGNSGYNLFDQTGQADWGYNAISNGGNEENSGWHTLTREEWDYLFNTRSTSSGRRYAKAKVNGVNGVILLPDDWQTSYYSLNSTNSSSAYFSNNTITADQWATLEQHGAVFLPAAGDRDGTSVYNVGSDGYYWSASCSDYSNAYYVDFGDGGLGASNFDYRYYGQSVRLVRAVENYSFGINASPSPAEGGAVSGAGAYQAGAECTLTATASAGYTFVNWTENGEVVSTNPTYLFEVTRNRRLVANFSPLHWSPESSAYEDFMAVIGVVQIDGEEQNSTALELGAFCGDECRGTTMAAYFPPTQRYLYQLPVFGNNGDIITFKLYDHAQQQELDLSSETQLTINDSGYGSLANPQVINFISPVTIATSVYPLNAGTVSGAGLYFPGTTATLIATANEGYAFNSWKNLFDFETGLQGWTTIDADGDGYNWMMISEVYPGDGGHNSSEGVLSQSYSSGALTPDNYLVSPQIELGGQISFWASAHSSSWAADHFGVAVSTSGNTNPADFTMLNEWTMTAKDAEPYRVPREKNNRQGNWYQYIVDLSAFAGQTGYVAIRHFNCTDQWAILIDEIDLGTVVSTDEAYTFIVEGARHLTAVFDRVQTTALGNGWNWYSTYIEQDGINGLEQLEASLGSNGLLIKSRSGLMVENYDGSYWWGGLTAIDNSQMYEIKTSQACEVSMQGQQAQASQHPATIKPGWNWIGYPCDTEMSLEQAMSSLSPNEDDMVKSHTGFSSYFPNWGWYGLLETLEPGQGYKYNSKGSANQSLVYPAPSKDAGHTTRAAIKTHFENHGLGCRDNMSVMATVSLDGMELSGERYELAAFVGGVCHGSVKLMYVEPLHGDVAFLTVLGDANDAVTFRLYDEETGLTYEAEEGVAFEADAVLGNQHERFPVRFKSTALAATRPLLFPNPVGRGERVFVENVQKGEVMEVVNQLGVTLKTVKLAGANTAWDCDFVPGVYTVRILKDQQTLSVEKLIVK